MNILDWIALIVVIIGALNWGLVGLLNLDLVVAILGTIPYAVKTVYIIVGLAGLWMIYTATKLLKK